MTWKIHLFMIITVTLKPHHWTIARMDRITVHWHNQFSSITSLFFQFSKNAANPDQTINQSTNPSPKDPQKPTSIVERAAAVAEQLDRERISDASKMRERTNRWRCLFSLVSLQNLCTSDAVYDHWINACECHAPISDG